jgi:hypothetical protein
MNTDVLKRITGICYVNHRPADYRVDTGSDVTIIVSKYVYPSQFTGACVTIRQAVDASVRFLPVAKVLIDHPDIGVGHFDVATTPNPSNDVILGCDLLLWTTPPHPSIFSDINSVSRYCRTCCVCK